MNPKHFRKNNGLQPVASDVMVDVRVRAGKQVCTFNAGYFMWDISPLRSNQGDIISWRLAQ